MGVTSAPRHLVHVFPSFGIGGVETRIARVVNRLGRRYRHTIFALDGKYDAAARLNDDLEFELARIPWRKTRLLSVANLAAARGAIRRIRPDLMLSYNWGTVEWGLACRGPGGCPHIHFESGFGPDETPERQYRRRIVARRLFLSNCSFIVVPSITLREIATRRWRFPPHRVQYIPNGVDCERFVEASAIAQRPPVLAGIPDGVAIVGTVAMLRPEKNLPRLIRIFGALQEPLAARLVIVGDGPEGATLRDLAQRSPASGRIVFVGRLPDPSMILGCFDVFALTSDTEQMPNALLEAMAACRAIAATDVGDVKTMVSAENLPFVIPPPDEAALGSAIGRLLRDPPLARRIGAANRERARTQFSLEAMVQRYDALFSGGRG